MGEDVESIEGIPCQGELLLLMLMMMELLSGREDDLYVLSRPVFRSIREIIPVSDCAMQRERAQRD